MKTLTLNSKYQTNVTLITNDFIDSYMPHANGEFVKVYVFLLRHLDVPCSTLTVSTIADCLNNTENDILRAFRYWESEGLLSLEKDHEGRITGIELVRTPFPIETDNAPTMPAAAHVETDNAPTMTAADLAGTATPSMAAAPAMRATSAVLAKSVLEGDEPIPMDASRTAARFIAMPNQIPAAEPSGTSIPMSEAATAADPPPTQGQACTPMAKAIPLTSFKAQKELKSLLFIAEQYLGKTLSRTDVDAITYFYETLSMSADLIEYLIESCVENGHKSMHYIQKVALSWSDNGITSAEQARRQSKSYNKNCYTVLNAFGIKNRGPAATELAFINKWTQELGFSLDIIQEACNRTISATHQPSFEYADSILNKWHVSQVRHLKDVAVLDEAFQKEKTTKIPMQNRQKPVSKNMNNFERRAYDMESLEEQLLNSN